jgi:transposase InsO family protein
MGIEGDWKGLRGILTYRGFVPPQSPWIDTKRTWPQVEEYLEEEGIKHEFSAPYTPQQNGVVERKNRTLIDIARTMLGEFKTPKRFWPEAVNTTCHTINRVYLHRLVKKTSYGLLTANKPNVHIFVYLGVNATF